MASGAHIGYKISLDDLEFDFSVDYSSPESPNVHVNIHFHPERPQINPVSFSVKKEPTSFTMKDNTGQPFAHGSLRIIDDPVTSLPGAVYGKVHYGRYQSEFFDGQMISLTPYGPQPPIPPIPTPPVIPPIEPPAEEPVFSEFHPDGISQVIMKNREFDLFKFTNLRSGDAPPYPPKEQLPFIAYPGSGQLYVRIKAWLDENKSSSIIQQKARAYFNEHQAAIQQATAFFTPIYKTLDENPDPFYLSTLTEYFQKTLKADPLKFLSQPQTHTFEQMLWDGMMATTLMGRAAFPQKTQEMVQGIQVLQLIKRCAEKDESLNVPRAVYYALRAVILLPDDLFLVRSLSSKPAISASPPESDQNKPSDATKKKLTESDNNPSIKNTQQNQVLSANPTSKSTVTQASRSDFFSLSKHSSTGQSSSTSSHSSSSSSNGGTTPPHSSSSGSSSGHSSSSNPFDPSKGQVRLLGFGDLYVVRQELKRYVLGEIARIENAMVGQYLDFSNHKILRQEEVKKTISQTTHLKENDIANFQRELDQVTTEYAKQFQLDDKTGLKRTYDGTSETLTGGYTVTAIQPEKVKDYAMQIIDRALQSYTIKQQNLNHWQQFSETKDSSINILDNKAGKHNICGIFRQINKIYTAELYYLGYRLLVECLVLDPAQNYQHQNEEWSAPTPPRPLPANFSPTQISPNNYFQLYSDYEVDNGPLPPAHVKTISVPTTSNPPSVTGMVQMPNDYYPSKANISYITDGKMVKGIIASLAFSSSTTQTAPDQLSVGLDNKNSGSSSSSQPSNAPIIPKDFQTGTIEVSWKGPTQEMEKISLSAFTDGNYFELNADINCRLKDQVYEQWQQEAFRAIVATHNKHYIQYKEQTASTDIFFKQQEIILKQLKEKCIRQMLQKILHQNPVWPLDYYERFLNQAFLWDEMTYTLLAKVPSSNEDHPEWPDIYQEYGQDPLFQQFLNAKAARVNIAVRLDFDWRVFYLLFIDGSLPQKPFSSIIPEGTEQFARDIIPGRNYPWRGILVGEPWELELPTNMVKIQDDDSLPIFPPKKFKSC